MPSDTVATGFSSGESVTDPLQLLEKIGHTLRTTNLSLSQANEVLSTLVGDLSNFRPYQLSGTAKLYQEKRFLLFDQPGLGKTPQTLLALRLARTRHNVVVAPTACFGVWKNEIAKWYPEARYINIPGQEKEREKAIRAWLTWLKEDKLGQPYFLICSANCFQKLGVRGWNSICFDEPHRYGIANPKSTIFEHARRCRSEYLFLITGTPMKKGIEQLWSYLHLLDPKAFGSKWRFMNQHCASMQGEFGGREFLGIKDPAALRALLSRYGIRRLKKDVLPQLPPKQRQAIPVEMSAKLKHIYDELDSELMAETDEGGVAVAANRGGLRTKLRKLLLNPRCQGFDLDSPHKDVVKEICQQRIDEHEKIYIFSPFVDEMCLNAIELEEELKIPTHVIHGQQKNEANEASLNEFKSKKGSRILFSTVQMGISWDIAEQCSTGIGWGLSDAPDDMRQSEDRLHRFLTKSPVNIYYPICQDSVEEQQMMILDRKTNQQSLILDRA